jgi:hypothetical protein
MAIVRDDRWVSDALGRALAGAQVFYCTQPASIAVLPPSPLATLYTSTAGSETVSQPLITDGFGHAFTYADNSVLYTIVIAHPLFPPNPSYNNLPVVVLMDQILGGGGGGSGASPFQGVPQGTIDGANRTFILTNNGTPLTENPEQVTVWLNFPLVPGVGYSGPTLVSGFSTIVFATAPQPASGGNPGDSIYNQGWLA